MSQMIEVKTAELIGPALDWAVAKANGFAVQVRPYAEFCNASTGHKVKARYHRVWYEFDGDLEEYSPSADWAQGGPLVDKLMRSGKWELVPWFGGVLFQNYTSECMPVDGQSWDVQSVLATGKTVLIAACRAIVAAKLGDVVGVPAELVGAAK